MDLMDLLDMEKEVFRTSYDGRLITITERRGVRTLKCNGLVYSRLDRKSLYTHEYWDFFIPLVYAYKNPRILMIGLGGGTIALQLSKLFGSRLSLDIVESDKRIAGIYPKFLGTEVKCNIIIDEGARYVSNHRNEYDIVILDAYEPEGVIPFHFLEEKFVADAYNCLKKDGIFAANCIGSMVGPSLDSFIQNLSRRFEVYRLDTSGFTMNVVLVCTKSMGKDELVKKIGSSIKADKENEFLINSYERAKRVFITS